MALYLAVLELAVANHGTITPGSFWVRTQPMGDITQKHLPLVMLVENLLRIIPVSCNEQALPSSEESSGCGLSQWETLHRNIFHWSCW